MFKLKPIIFDKFFGRGDKTNDPYKDVNNKGINERYQEILADDWDEELLPLVENILDNTLVPDTAWVRFIPYLENMLGIKPLVEDLAIRRKIIKNIISIYKVKGTLRSYEIVFKILGFTSVTIEDLEFVQSFDSPVTFDDVNRRFDASNCQTCSYYNLHLTGDFLISSELAAIIIRAVEMVEPINAKLYKVTFNDINIDFSIFVAANGDLIYDNILGVVTDFNLSTNGDLSVEDTNPNIYSINNGNLLQDE